MSIFLKCMKIIVTKICWSHNSLTIRRTKPLFVTNELSRFVILPNWLISLDMLVWVQYSFEWKKNVVLCGSGSVTLLSHQYVCFLPFLGVGGWGAIVTYGSKWVKLRDALDHSSTVHTQSQYQATEMESKKITMSTMAHSGHQSSLWLPHNLCAGNKTLTRQNAMPQLSRPHRDQAIGMLHAGQSARIIAMTFGVHHSTVVRLA